MSERPNVVNTVGDLRELLKDSEDEEPLVLKLDDTPEGAGYLKCTGSSSSGGGRITILWFDNKDSRQIKPKFKVGGSVFVSEPPFNVYEVLLISWNEDVACVQHRKPSNNISFIPMKSIFATMAEAQADFDKKK